MEKFAVSRLVGAPPGYVGYEEGGQLTEKVRRKPYSVILLDEIEKAHPDVFNILLQILDDGQLTDSFGRKVNFRNVVLIMTSNIGARDITKGQGLGFHKEDDAQGNYSQMKERVLDEVRRTFNPEFLNRIEGIIVFHPLEESHMVEIVDILLRQLGERLSKRTIYFTIDTPAKDLIVEKGFDPRLGARPLRRTIQRMIEDPLAEEMLKGTVKAGETIAISRDGERLAFQPKRDRGEIKPPAVVGSAEAPDTGGRDTSD
jgi:ATP-dependent Clp protease ATP-binding subunit ClpC